MREMLKSCFRHKLRNLLIFIQMVLVFAYLMMTMMSIQRAFKICAEVPKVLGDGWENIVHCEISDDNEEDVSRLLELNNYLKENNIMDGLACYEPGVMHFGSDSEYNYSSGLKMEWNMYRMAGFDIRSGRGFCEEDKNNGTSFVLVGAELADRQGMKEGDIIRDSYSDIEYEVIGVLDYGNRWFVNSVSDGDIQSLDNQAVTLMREERSNEYIRVHYYGYADGTVSAGEAADFINGCAADLGLDVHAESVESELDEIFNAILSDNIGWLVFAGVIAIMVATGTASLMAANLYSRKREVGIRMAFGWSPLKIIFLFAGEMALIIFAAFGMACLVQYLSVGSGYVYVFTWGIALFGALGAVIMCIPSFVCMIAAVSKFRPKNLIGGRE